MIEKHYKICILGAGPAGLACGLELTDKGQTNICILDKHLIPGGLSRTQQRDKYKFDVGPHRFFTCSIEVNQLWHSTLGADFVPINRLTRIYYRDKFFNYPIKVGDVLLKMPPHEILHSMLSFSTSKFRNNRSADTFEEWVTNMFGEKLYKTFFKTYTEKVWGIPCNEIGAEWASQRIKGLDFGQLIKNSMGFAKATPKTLVDQFDYPINGAGQMYNAWLEKLDQKNVSVFLGSRITHIEVTDYEIDYIVCKTNAGEDVKITAKQFVGSLPLTHFYKLQGNIDNKIIKNSINALYYRDHITIDLLLDGEDFFPDQWVYIHSPRVKMARIANYNNFSKSMANYENKTCISVEYFAFQTDDLWSMSDTDLKSLAIDEMEMLKLISREKVLDSWVVRETEAYPTYYLGFKQHYNTVIEETDRFKNYIAIGRGGMYKYNNQDHSILSGIMAARKIINPKNQISLWDINIDDDYHEKATRQI